MANQAALKDQKTGRLEETGITRLDIVKHAAKTIAKVLGPTDRLGIVSFDTVAQVDLELTGMNEEGQTKALRVLESLEERDSTNIWDGLHAGLEVLRKAERQGRLASVFLLTDGEPNQHPPRGYVPTLQEYKALHPAFHCAINTFGFSYSLNSRLLRDLAEESDGAFAFIPDGGFVGTCFVNATSNLLASVAHSATLSLQCTPGVRAELLGPFRREQSETAVSVRLGALQSGQSRDVVVRLTLPKGASLDSNTVQATLTYSLPSQPTPLEARSSLVEPSPETELQRLRLLAVSVMLEAVEASNPAALAPLIKEIESHVTQQPDQRLADLLFDLKGQVTEAFEPAHFKKWGRHYVPSLAAAHFLQQCNNFKDKGVQHYGGQLFEALRDIADDVFLSLPPPKPSRPVPPPDDQPAPAPVSIHRYYDAEGVCFAGSSLVQLADGSLLPCAQVRRGTQVLTATGQAAQVLCVVETYLPPSCKHKSQAIPLVSLPSLLSNHTQPLLVTPYHPLRVPGSQWSFPVDLAPPSAGAQSVFSFLLDREHVMMINGYQCVSLAHGLQGPVVEHAFFGTQSVASNLARLDGWSEGHVRLTPACIRRLPQNGLVHRLDPSLQFATSSIEPSSPAKTTAPQQEAVLAN